MSTNNNGFQRRTTNNNGVQRKTTKSAKSLEERYAETEERLTQTLASLHNARNGLNLLREEEKEIQQRIVRDLQRVAALNTAVERFKKGLNNIKTEMAEATDVVPVGGAPAMMTPTDATIEALEKMLQAAKAAKAAQSAQTAGEVNDVD
jgi:chromosome segregation ATPase